MLLYIDVQTPFFIVSFDPMYTMTTWPGNTFTLKILSFKYLLLKKNASSLSWHLPIQPYFWFSSLAPSILLSFQNLYFLPGLIYLL